MKVGLWYHKKVWNGRYNLNRVQFNNNSIKLIYIISLRIYKPTHQYAKSSLLSNRPFLFALAPINQSNDKIIKKQTEKKRPYNSNDSHQSNHGKDRKSVRHSLKFLTGLQVFGSQANLHGCEYNSDKYKGAEHPSGVLHKERTIGVIIGIITTDERTMLRTSPKAMDPFKSLEPKFTEMIASVDPIQQINVHGFSSTLNISSPLRPRNRRYEIELQRKMEIALAYDQPSVREKKTAGFFMEGFCSAKMGVPKVVITKISGEWLDKYLRIRPG